MRDPISGRGTSTRRAFRSSNHASPQQTGIIHDNHSKCPDCQIAHPPTPANSAMGNRIKTAMRISCQRDMRRLVRNGIRCYSVVRRFRQTFVACSSCSPQTLLRSSGDGTWPLRTSPKYQQHALPSENV